MNININRPMTNEQLASVYGGDPHEAASRLFMNAPQARTYVQQQAARMGISDPESFFAQAQMQRALKAVPSGAESEAARLSGSFAPNSLPGQLAARDAMWDSVAKQNAAKDALTAAHSYEATTRAYPLPAAGESVALSPLAAKNAAGNNIAPLQYAQYARLGQNKMVGNVEAYKMAGQTNPDDIYNHKSFQTILQTAPEKAHQVFNALTGGDLKNYEDRTIASRKDQQNFARESLQKAFAEGRASMSPDGQHVVWRKMIPSESDPSKLVLSPDYGEGDAFQKSLEGHLEHVSPDIKTFMKLSAERHAEQAATAQQVASMQKIRPQLNEEDFRVPGVYPTAMGPIDRLNNILAPVFGLPDRVGMARGVDPVRVAPQLRNNPRFQQLMRDDPAAAQRLILAIRNRNLPETEALQPDYSTPATY